MYTIYCLLIFLCSATYHGYYSKTDFKVKEIAFMSGASEKAYQIIRKRLVAGEYEPGARLNEQELSDLCGVSRTPVREAIRRLALEYFVSIEPNRGAFVIDWSRDDIDDMFELRAMLEGFAARKAAERNNIKICLQLNEIIKKIDFIVSQENAELMDDFLELNRQFHEHIFYASGSRRLIEMISRFVEQAVVVRTAAQYSTEDIRRSNQYHRELAAAISAGDGGLAQTLMQAHILTAAGRYHDAYIAPQTVEPKVIMKNAEMV